MDSNERKKTFLELGRGAMLERFDYELKRIVDNIRDPNTPATKPRKISLMLTLTPDANRECIQYEVVVKSTPQPTSPISGATALMSRGGQVSLVELVPQIPGQADFDGGEQRQPDIIQLRREA